MGYSVINTGRSHLNQSQAIMSELARQEAQRNATNEQIKAQEDAARSSNMGTMAGMGFAEDINRYQAAQSAAPQAAIDANAATGGGQIISDAATADALGTVGGETGANAAIGGGQIISDAALAESGAAALGAEGAAGAAGSSVAGASAGAAGAGAAGAGTAAVAAETAALGAGTAAGGGAGAAGGAKAGASFGPWGALAGLAIGYLASSLF